jgi:hypothetical protein
VLVKYWSEFDYLRLEVLTAVKMAVFWVVTPCGLVSGYQHFEGTHQLSVRFEVYTAVKMLTFFWAVTLLRLIGRYQRFGETYCLHLQLETLVSTYKFTRRHNPEEQHRHPQIRENLKFHTDLVVLNTAHCLRYRSIKWTRRLNMWLLLVTLGDRSSLVPVGVLGVLDVLD